METSEHVEHQPTRYGIDWLLDAIGDKPVIFQDLLDAGYDLREVEQISGDARALGYHPVTVSVFLEITDEDRVLQSRALPHILGRLRREF